MSKNHPRPLNLIAQTLYDKKGFNILVLDVRGVSTLTDYFILAEGNVDMHVTALARAVIEVMEKEQEKPFHVEAVEEGDWAVLDFVDIVVHLFKPGWRDKYRLEELWHEGLVVDIVFKQQSKV